jgi:hypothetical protein
MALHDGVLTMTTHKPMSAKHRRIMIAHVEGCVRLVRRSFGLYMSAPSFEWDAIHTAKRDLQIAITALAIGCEPEPPRHEKAGKL